MMYSALHMYTKRRKLPFQLRVGRLRCGWWRNVGKSCVTRGVSCVPWLELDIHAKISLKEPSRNGLQCICKTLYARE